VTQAEHLRRSCSSTTPVLLASTPDTAAVGLGQSGPVDLVAQQDDDLKILGPA